MLFHNLVKKCLTIKEKYRIDFEKLISHPFFDTIAVGRIENKKAEYKEGEGKDFLNINLINISKMFFNKLDLECFEESNICFENLGKCLNDYEDKIKKEDEKDKLKDIFIYKLLESEIEDEINIKNILININSFKERYYDFMFPFILFLSKNVKETEIKVNKLIEKQNLTILDKRFIFYCELSNITEIKNIIYRAYSYYNECGDIFNLGEKEIDLRKNIFEFYFNIICIARSQMGKSTFINRYISSFNPENVGELRAKEGGNERACSTKFAQYYVNNYPIKIIDIIGYDGEQDTIEKLNDIVNKMSILLEQDEIHIILYLIKYDSDSLFYKNEVAIFERLQLNAIKPKILFIRTQSKINIYSMSEDEKEYNLDNLNPREKKDIEKKLQLMNTNFKTIKQGNKWTNIIKYIFSKGQEQEVQYFNLNNVCFMNLCLKEETNGEDIKPFGMKYFKNKLFNLFQEIKEEEIARAEKWLKLQEKLNDDNVDLVNIIKEMNFYNIYTKSLSEEASRLHKSLIDDNMNTRIKIDIKDIPIEIGLLFSNRGLIFMINFFTYKIWRNKEENITNIVINKKSFRDILINFISYKTKAISSIEYYFNNDANNNNFNNLLIDDKKQQQKKDNNFINKTNNDLSQDIFENLNNISLETIIDNLNVIKSNKDDSFMISVLQCLIHCTPLISSFLIKKNYLKKLSKEFFNLSVIVATNNLISWNYFKNSIHEKKILNGEIHEPIKFLIYFLKKINKEIYNKNTKFNKIEYENISKLEACNKYKEEYIKKQIDNFIETYFHLHFISSLECSECKNKIYLFEEDNNLLLIYNNDIDLKLNNYFQKEELEKDCAKCNKKTNHIKIKKIYIAPEILILNIQQGKKNLISDEKLEISQLMDEDLKLKIEYNLISVIDYLKEGENDKYFSHIKIKNKWHKFGDELVEEDGLNFRDVCPSILFYQKLHDDKN